MSKRTSLYARPRQGFVPIMAKFKHVQPDANALEKKIEDAISLNERYFFNIKSVGMADELEYWLVDFLSFVHKHDITEFDNYPELIERKYDNFKDFSKDILSNEIAFAFADKFDELHDKVKILMDALFVEFARVNRIGVSYMLMIKTIAELAEFFEKCFNDEVERRTGIVRSYYVQDVIDIKNITNKTLQSIELYEDVCYKTKLSRKLIKNIINSYSTFK